MPLPNDILNRAYGGPKVLLGHKADLGVKIRILSKIKILAEPLADPKVEIVGI